MASDAFNASEQQRAAAHRALLQTHGLQLDFKAAPQPPEPPGWLVDLLRGLAQMGPVFRFVFWGGLALAVLMIGVFIYREVVASRFKAAEKTTAQADWRPEPEQARALLEAADRLAAEGKFAEAIHLLLFRSIDDLAGRRPGVVRPALTSRDIAELPQLPENARGAFASIARRVEMSFFGGRGAGPEDFGGARGVYEAFAFSEDWA